MNTVLESEIKFSDTSRAAVEARFASWHKENPDAVIIHRATKRSSSEEGLFLLTVKYRGLAKAAKVSAARGLPPPCSFV
jgi:hypothetical protein